MNTGDDQEGVETVVWEHSHVLPGQMDARCFPEPGSGGGANTSLLGISVQMRFLCKLKFCAN